MSVLALVVGAIAVAVSENTSRPATPARTTVLAAVTTLTRSRRSTSSERDARAWIAEYGGDAANVAANVSDVQLALSELRRTPTQANINQLGSMAQTASDGIRTSDGLGSSAAGIARSRGAACHARRRASRGRPAHDRRLHG